MALISVENVTKIFGPTPKVALRKVKAGMGKTELLAETGHTLGLSDVSLSIEEGEIFVIMGLSGSGKSTLIRHFNRLIDPTAGKIVVDGEDVLRLSVRELEKYRRKRMSMVFQRFGLFPHRTVLDNVAYGLEVQNVGVDERHERARTWIARVGLDGYEDQFPAQLSGGMQQRVGLARALATDADILLMDEAFSALDPLIRSQMQDQLVDLQDQFKKTIVFITHDLDEALKIGDKIAILKDGVLSQVGTPAEILMHPADDYVADFVRDVNRARVLTVDVVTQPPKLRLTDENLQNALDAMRSSGEDVGYVVGPTGSYLGLVTEDKLADAVASSNHSSLADLADESHQVDASSSIEEVLPAVLDTDHPVPVISNEGELTGVVYADKVGSILSPSAVHTESNDNEALDDGAADDAQPSDQAAEPDALESESRNENGPGNNIMATSEGDEAASEDDDDRDADKLPDDQASEQQKTG